MPENCDEIQYWSSRLINDAALTETPLYLVVSDVALVVRSNSNNLLAKLKHYFSHIVVAGCEPTIEVIAIEQPAPELNIDFFDWRREPGKTGRKDSYFDIPGGRLLRKVRTGMVFLQCEGPRIAAGPCTQNDNQVINFINAQFANAFQQQGALTCHAAGVVKNDQGFAVAGFSGGGKSTLMLHLLEHDHIKYLTNDRLYIRKQGNGVSANSIPKLPRVNPGTIVHNPRLQSLLSAARREQLLALPQAALWELEEKYDVFIDDLYGKDRIQMQAPLSGFLVLNWQRDSEHDLQVARVDLEERRDLLAAIMKSPGPFYQRSDGSLYQDSLTLDEQAYLEVLRPIPIYEASGRVDFTALAEICVNELMA